MKQDISNVRLPWYTLYIYIDNMIYRLKKIIKKKNNNMEVNIQRIKY